MHPHGVKYNPEYDGAYMGEYTRAGGFIAPGESFTYQWECTPAVGRRLAVPRPRAQPHAQHVPRPVRRDHRPPARREVAGPRCTRCSPTSCRRRSPGCRAQLPLHQRPRLRRQHADADRARRRGRRDPRRSAWTPTSTRSTSTATAGGIQRGRSSTTRRWARTRSVTARFVEDNPGRWLYHCHVFSHQDAGMAGWYVVDP